MMTAAPSYLARLKARGAEKGLSSNPQNPQKQASTAFEPFEGDLGGRFSRNAPASADEKPEMADCSVRVLAADAAVCPNGEPAEARGNQSPCVSALPTLDHSPADVGPAELCNDLKEVAPSTLLRGEYEERAAILEYDAGLPREWAEHFARLIVGDPPGDFSPTRWWAALDGALIFADRWGREAHRLGWDASEVFGLHSTAPAARVDCRGLAWLLGDGSQVVAMDRSGAEIRKPGGGRQRYYRRSFK